jgi:hypothetical protein
MCCYQGRNRHRFPVSATIGIFLEVIGIQENGRSHQQSFLLHRRIVGKCHFKGIRIGKDLHHGGFGFLQNLTHIRSVTIGVGLARSVHSKARFAAAFAGAGIAFGATVHAATTTAGRRMHRVHVLALIVADLVLRNTVVAVFLDRSQWDTTRAEGCCLVAAALTGSGSARARTFHSQELRLRVDFLDDCHKGTDEGTEESAAAGSIV